MGGDGSPGRTRTSDPAINSRLLYQLSYWGSPRSGQAAAAPSMEMRISKARSVCQAPDGVFFIEPTFF